MASYVLTFQPTMLLAIECFAHNFPQHPNGCVSKGFKLRKQECVKCPTHNRTSSYKQLQFSVQKILELTDETAGYV